MQDAFDSVRQFHVAMNAPVSARPMLLACEQTAASALAERVKTLATETMANAPVGDVLLSRAGDILLSEAGVWAHCPPRHTRAPARDVPIDGQSVRWLAPDEGMPAGCRSLQVARVRLEVWAHVYDPSTSQLLAKRLASARRPQP